MKESEKFTNLVKRFKDLVKDQKLEIEQERLAKLPKICSKGGGLFTNINMAFKMAKGNHDICVEGMTSDALTQEDNKTSWSLAGPLCPKDKNTKLKISHSQLNEVQDPQNFILSKIFARKYQEYVYRNIDLVDHNIGHFKELVIREDNVIMNQRGSKLTFGPGCKLEYEFNNPPYILSCCHRLCRNGISQYYKENSDTIIIPCAIDEFSNQYVKPKALLQDQENAEQFNNFNSFLEIVLQIDYELFDEIFNANNNFGDEDLIIREVYIQGEGKFTERMKSNSVISNNANKFGQTLNKEKFIEQLKYDGEGPIGMMFYGRENPPLIYEGREHSYKIGRDSMMMFLKMAEKKNENLTINGPIGSNTLEFDTLGKTIDEGIEEFKIDYNLLDKIDKYPELHKMIEDDYANY